MVEKAVTRRALLDRWRGIEEADNDDHIDSPHQPRLLRQLKEEWFSDAFNFLVSLPSNQHIWCSSWDLMGPLLETFYNYFKDESDGSPLKVLWARISNEMRQCTQCICQHHQAQETYRTEYEPSSIGPLLEVLCTLDEERVSSHLKESNARVALGQNDTHENAEVVCLMFEVLMFPYLLEDRLLASEFEKFTEAVDNSHELAFIGHQQYPGVYALLFLKSRRVRSIGFRLAGHMGRLRKSMDLEPLQPLLKKCIGFLETDMVPLVVDPSRPRVQMDRITVWLGIKALLGFLEAPAFEEGILDRYPVFLSIVLNHISDDSPEFSYAVNCLRLLLEMLGCKLWLRTTLSASVMRNTLLGQCFHTRNEKIHKEIFDLFLPFLQSLEALQDGEHEKQRRHFLYFLLHQVTVSSNFSILMRKKACQIALLIVYRGYRMNPPSPPYECAHMWGPSLVSSLRDSSLHSSLRQPAFDLIQIIIVSDASALVASILKSHLSNDRVVPITCIDEKDEKMLFDIDVEEKDISCWTDYHLQCQITSLVYEGWMCIPMLWFDVLVGIDPLILPVSFSKAVFWATSRFAMVAAENITTIGSSVENWLKDFASEISHLLGWKAPSGSDDGGDGMQSKNSIVVSKMCMPLIQTFRRFASYYIARMEQGELMKQWTWEPMMADSLILLLFDPHENDRQVSRRILEQFSNGRSLTHGLQFLCSSQSSLVAILIGLRHALKLVQLDAVLTNFQILHHFFFVLCKLIKEGYPSIISMGGNSSEILNGSQFSSQGGFLRQPAFATGVDNLRTVVSSTVWEKFCCLISEIAWSSVQKCLEKGKALIDHKISQMTCIRLLEILPVILEKLFRNPGTITKSIPHLGWLQDLVEWGGSSLTVVFRYWKQTLQSLLSLFKNSCSNVSASIIAAVENILSSDNFAMVELGDQVARLSVSLMEEGYFASKKVRMKPKSLNNKELSHDRNCEVQNIDLLLSKDATELPYTGKNIHKEPTSLILLSDDEKEPDTLVDEDVDSHTALSEHILDAEVVSSDAIDSELHPNLNRKLHSEATNVKNPPEALLMGSAQDFYDPPQKLKSSAFAEKLVPTSHVESEGVGVKEIEELSTKHGVQDSCRPQNLSDLNLSGKTIDLGTSEPSSMTQLSSDTKQLSDKNMKFKNNAHKGIDKVWPQSEGVKEAANDTEDGMWEFSFFKSARQKSSSKPVNSFLKRQVIQLNLPVGNRSGHGRIDGQIRRFKVPSLDDWYKPILELDYFATVGLSSIVSGRDKVIGKLKEVPVCFKSPDEYVEVFRPLVLEEFKAQLNSSFQETGSIEEMCCVTISVLSIERVDDFHILRCAHDNTDSGGSRSCLEHDLVLLTRQPLQCSSNDIHMVGKVERRELDSKRKLNILVIRLYLQNGCSRLNQARKLLVERSKWCISHLMSITPQLREFHALSSIKEIPLLPVILNPKSHPYDCHNSTRKSLSKLSQPLQEVLQSSYNDSQLQAISTSIGILGLKKDFELSLIQGPPGTGKTRTIVAIVSALLAFSRLGDNKKSPNDCLKSTNLSCAHSRLQINQSAAIARAWQDAALARQLNEDAERNTKLVSSCSRGGRVLICAQSNAAVDELVSRISTGGLYGSDGLTYKPYLVRVGNVKTVHPNSLPFFIDTLVDQRLSEESVKGGKNDSHGDSISNLRSNLESLVAQIRFYEAKRANLRDGNSDIARNLLEGEIVKGCEREELSDAELEAKLRRLYEKKKVMYKDLSNAQAEERKANEESRALKHKLRKAILKEAEIVVTTLSGSGGDLYAVCAESISSHKFSSSSESTLFDAVVIDEAAQALEPATLIPLQLLKSKGTKCIMVGDPKQLPATVLSNVASKYLFQCSMFERLQRAGHPVIMLTQQYRMHPEICRFPALHFYDGKLKNGNDKSRKAAVFHETNGLGPYVFFDVIDGQESRKKSSALSLCNEREAEAAVEVLKFFKKKYPLEFVGGRIGVVTPYKSQLNLLRLRFANAFGSSLMAEMEFNTVDGFQGREVDILVLSTVRAAEQFTSVHSIGFVADVRRMNVALTRAKLSLWIIGNARTLQTNENWAALLKDAKHRGLVIPLARPYSSISGSNINKDQAVEGSENHFRQLQCVEKVKGIHGQSDARKGYGKYRHEKRMVDQSSVDAVAGKNEHAHWDIKNVSGGRQRRMMDARKTPTTNDASSAEYKSQNSKCSKSLVKEVSKDGSASKKTGDKLIKIPKDVHDGNSNEYTRSNLEKFKKVVSETQTETDVNSAASKESIESLKCKGRQTVGTSLGSSKGSFKDKDVRDVDSAASQADRSKNTMIERKQQRDAVDALLSSSLISSRKPESSLKSLPVKRNLSSASTESRAMRSTKSRKGS